jgi:hypothetical protein
MKKTYQIHLRIEKEAIDHLKKEAEDCKITLAELCRIKIRNMGVAEKMDTLLQKVESLISAKFYFRLSRQSGRWSKVNNDKFYKINKSKSNIIDTLPLRITQKTSPCKMP